MTENKPYQVSTSFDSLWYADKFMFRGQLIAYNI